METFIEKKLDSAINVDDIIQEYNEINGPERLCIIHKLLGYEVTGDVDFTPWGGGNYQIQMDPSFIPIEKGLTDENIYRCVNDNGFGCESIDHAFLTICKVYDGNMKIFEKDIELNKDACVEFQDYFFRGI